MYLEIKNLKKSYGEGEGRQQVLKGITASLEQGKMCVIEGASGSGKSTLLNCIGGLEIFEEGSVQVEGQELFGLSAESLLEYRREKLGFVFQFYHLVPDLTVRENILLCEYLSASPLSLEELLEVLGLQDHQHKFPHQLSGGQRQRCAIARALIKNPALLLCDEPTGALDSVSSKETLMLLEKVNAFYHTTMLIVTHDLSVREMVDRVIHLRDGKIIEDYNNLHKIPAAALKV